jgi:hypothetical protein
MNIKSLTLITLLLIFRIASAQTWETYELTGIGKISIPKTLELRDKKSLVQKNFDNSIKQFEQTYKVDFPPSTLTFQPAGINSTGKSENYSRIIFTIIRGKKGDFPDSKYLNTITKTDKNQLDELYSKATISSLKKINIDLLKWFSPEIINIKGVAAYKTFYNRRLGTNPVVYVENYRIFNNDLSIDITLSYRVEESEIWESDFAEIVKKLYIEKR